jgi:hypothetical protein
MHVRALVALVALSQPVARAQLAMYSGTPCGGTGAMITSTGLPSVVGTRRMGTVVYPWDAQTMTRPATYPNDQKCLWTVVCINQFEKASVRFTSFDTEVNRDKVCIYGDTGSDVRYLIPDGLSPTPCTLLPGDPDLLPVTIPAPTSRGDAGLAGFHGTTQTTRPEIGMSYTASPPSSSLTVTFVSNSAGAEAGFEFEAICAVRAPLGIQRRPY